MLAYAANRPRVGASRSSPNTLLFVACGHIALLAVAMSVKMALPPRIIESADSRHPDCGSEAAATAPRRHAPAAAADQSHRAAGAAASASDGGSPGAGSISGPSLGRGGGGADPGPVLLPPCRSRRPTCRHQQGRAAGDACHRPEAAIPAVETARRRGSDAEAAADDRRERPGRRGRSRRPRGSGVSRRRRAGTCIAHWRYKPAIEGWPRASLDLDRDQPPLRARRLDFERAGGAPPPALSSAHVLVSPPSSPRAAFRDLARVHAPAQPRAGDRRLPRGAGHDRSSSSSSSSTPRSARRRRRRSWRSSSIAPTAPTPRSRRPEEGPGGEGSGAEGAPAPVPEAREAARD